MSKELFADLVEEHKDKFNCATMFGVPISEIEGDELRACLCELGKLAEQQIKYCFDVNNTDIRPESCQNNGF